MHSFCLVFEDAADAQIAAGLADRVLCDSIEWLREDAELLETQREWLQASPDGVRLRWCQIKEIALGMRLPIRGRFDGANELPDFKAALRAIYVVRELFDDAAAIILMRDSDKQVLRREGLIRARTRFEESGNTCTVIIGLAVTKRECWILSGFEPCSDKERAALAELTRELGTNPVLANENLTAQGDRDRRNAKRVLSILTDEDQHREIKCWQETSLELLRQRGTDNGLADYLHEVHNRLVPILQPNNVSALTITSAEGGRAG